MQKLVCGRCNVALRIAKNGVVVCEMAGDPPAPYKLWSCDQWGCPECDAQIYASFAPAPIREHYESGFLATMERARGKGILVEVYEYR